MNSCKKNKTATGEGCSYIHVDWLLKIILLQTRFYPAFRPSSGLQTEKEKTKPAVRRFSVCGFPKGSVLIMTYSWSNRQGSPILYTIEKIKAKGVLQDNWSGKMTRILLQLLLLYSWSCFWWQGNNISWLFCFEF